MNWSIIEALGNIDTKIRGISEWLKAGFAGNFASAGLRSVLAAVPGLGGLLAGYTAIRTIYTFLNVSAFGSITTPSGFFLENLCFLNSIFPVSELLNSAVWWASLKLSLTTYRFVKSWVPTVS